MVPLHPGKPVAREISRASSCVLSLASRLAAEALLQTWVCKNELKMYTIGYWLEDGCFPAVSAKCTGPGPEEEGKPCFSAANTSAACAHTRHKKRKMCLICGVENWKCLINGKDWTGPGLWNVNEKTLLHYRNKAKNRCKRVCFPAWTLVVVQSIQIWTNY